MERSSFGRRHLAGLDADGDNSPTGHEMARGSSQRVVSAMPCLEEQMSQSPRLDRLAGNESVSIPVASATMESNPVALAGIASL
jgi:hypothetical protein